MGEPKFPQRVYVFEEGEGDESWWRVETSIDNCVSVGEETVIAVYELRQVGIGGARVEIDFTTKQ